MAVILNLVDPPLDHEHVTSEGSGLQVRCRLRQRLYATAIDPVSEEALRKSPPHKWHKVSEEMPVESSMPGYLYRNGVVFPVTLVYLEVKLIRGNREEGRPDELQHCLGLGIAGPSIGVPADAQKPSPRRDRARSPKNPRSRQKSSGSSSPRTTGQRDSPASTTYGPSQRPETDAPDDEDTILGF